MPTITRKSKSVKPSKLSQYLQARLARTDSIEIGSPLPSHANRLFAWAVSRFVAGNPVALNGELRRLSKRERLLLIRIRKQPDESASLVEKFQGRMTETEREAFAQLLSSVPNAPDPTVTATMADARKVVDGVKFLWPRWKPYAMITEIVAEPGVGKSGLALGGIVRSTILGCNWPDGTRGLDTWKYALWCDTEASMAITLDRIEKWKLPAHRILLPFPEDKLKPVQLENPEHISRLHNLINLKQPHELVVDSLRGAHKFDENSSRVAQVLENLADLVQRTRISCTLVHHTRKMPKNAEIEANDSRGSNAIIAMVRCQIGLDLPDPNSKWVRFQVLKENLGVKPKPMGFRIRNAGLEFGPAPEPPSRITKLDEAEAFLRERMSPGEEVPSNPLLEEAEALGMSKRTVQRAASNRLQIRPEKTKDGWTWTLPKNKKARELGLRVIQPE